MSSYHPIFSARGHCHRQIVASGTTIAAGVPNPVAALFPWAAQAHRDKSSPATAKFQKRYQLRHYHAGFVQTENARG